MRLEEFDADEVASTIAGNVNVLTIQLLDVFFNLRQFGLIFFFSFYLTYGVQLCQVRGRLIFSVHRFSFSMSFSICDNSASYFSFLFILPMVSSFVKCVVA